MRAHSRLAVAAAIGLGALVAGCGPRYQTFTSYAPPEDQAGRQCLAQCLSGRQLCRQNAQVQIQQCRLSAQTDAQIQTIRRLAEYNAELAQSHRRRRDAPEQPGTVSPNYGPCNSDAAIAEQRCLDDHDLCYQNCGGEVTYTTECVANCEE